MTLTKGKSSSSRSSIFIMGIEHNIYSNREFTAYYDENEQNIAEIIGVKCYIIMSCKQQKIDRYTKKLCFS